MTAGTALLLAPGAGADATQPSLVAIERALAELAPSVPVRRMDFPYRKAGRRAPDKEPVLLQAVRDEAAALSVESSLAPERLLLGGRSMGGRMCSIAVAGGLPARGLVLISYPLHPPGKPDKLRVAHFPQLTVPCLFVSGTRDAFGTPQELQDHTAAIPGPVTHVWIDGGDHGLRRRDDVVAETVSEWVAALP